MGAFFFSKGISRMIMKRIVWGSLRGSFFSGGVVYFTFKNILLNTGYSPRGDLLWETYHFNYPGAWYWDSYFFNF